MNLQQITYFLAAAEHGSFSAAARELHLAQPSISEQVRQLEAELGVELFARAGRGIAMTEAGKRFRPEAERVLADVDRARDAVRAVREIRGGSLSFGMFGTVSPTLIAEIAAEFRRCHADVRLRLLGQNSSEVADAVRNGKLEAGLVVLPVDDDGLDVRVAFREELVFVSRDRDRLAEPMTISRLATMPLILFDAHYGTADPLRRQLAIAAQRAGVTLRPTIDVEQMEAAVLLAARGVGDTILARSVLSGQRGARRLGHVSFAEPLYDTFAFISRDAAPLSPATQAMIEIVERRLSKLSEGAQYAGAMSESDG